MEEHPCQRNACVPPSAENARKQKPEIDRRKMFYKGYKNKYDFTKFKTIRNCGDATRNGKVKIDLANYE